MRILFLTKRFYTNQDLMSNRFGRLFHLPVELSKGGHEVVVLALDYRGKKPTTLDVDGVSFTSVPARGVGGVLLWRQLKRAVEDFGPDVVVGSADTPLGWLARRLARGAGKPFVFDVYDNYQAFASGRIPGIGRLFGRLLRSADLVVVASEPLLALARRRDAKAVLVVNGVDRQVFKPMDQETVRKSLGVSPGQRLVGYIGSLEPDRGIETLMAAVRRLRDSNVRVSLLFAGVDKMEVDEAVDWVDYRGWVPQADVPFLINACDVVVLPYLANEWGDYTYPNKLAEYVACGVPVVATSASSFATVLADAPQGLCVPGDPDSMARAIRAQLDHPVRLSTHTAASWAELAEQLASAIRALPRSDPAAG